MPIVTTCGKCKCPIKFPDTPNTDTDKYEALAHGIYTIKANEPDHLRLCGNCKPKRKIKRGR